MDGRGVDGRGVDERRAEQRRVDAATLAGLLAEPERLRVVAAVVLGAGSTADVVAATGLGARAVTRALTRLTTGGLVHAAGGGLRVDVEAVKEAARAAAPEQPAEDHGVADPAAAAVLRTFVRDGRLVQIPAVRGKRRVVLEHLALAFEPGVRYAEREVDAVLRAWHPDHAALRRHLVDEGLLTREAGVYWRSGGWVEV